MEKHIGIYICEGCEIGNCLDIDKLKASFDGEKAESMISHQALCSVQGYETISADVTDKGLNAVLIAACSPREKTNVFDFSEEIL